MATKETLTELKTLGELEHVKSGKVRETFRYTDRVLVFVATDRISAFDIVLQDGVPDKGKVLTGISKFFFRETKDICPSHFVSTRPQDFMELEDEVLKVLEGRTMLVEEMQPIPFECIVRGHLCGSAWREYEKTGGVAGQDLPKGLTFGDKLKTPIFTPTTKAESGHDQPVTFQEMVAMIGADDAEEVKRLSIELFDYGHRTAYNSGVVVIDTKFEFGYNRRGEICVMDEFMTPDSSRFWLKSDFKKDIKDQFYDKEYVRAYLSTLDWDKEPPAPHLPQEVIEEAQRRYRIVFEAITGQGLT